MHTQTHAHTHTCTHALTKSSREVERVPELFFVCPRVVRAAPSRAHTQTHAHTHTHHTLTHSLTHSPHNHSRVAPSRARAHTHTCTHTGLFFYTHSQDLKEVEWVADVHGDVRLLRFLRKCKGDTDAAVNWWRITTHYTQNYDTLPRIIITTHHYTNVQGPQMLPSIGAFVRERVRGGGVGV
jgi:hypothetical protein